MKETVSVTWDRKVVKEVDRRRGLASRSAYSQALVEWAMAGADMTFAPHFLKGARVEHTRSGHLGSGKVFVNVSQVHPTIKSGESGEDRGLPFSVPHDLLRQGDDELPAGEKVRSGLHTLNPLRCSGCKLVLRDVQG